MNIEHDIEQLWSALAARGVELFAREGKLGYRGPEHALTPALLEQLRQHKTALLERLAGQLHIGALTRAAGGGAPALSAAQRALWIAEQSQQGPAAYNIALALRLRGPLAVPRLRRALQHVVRRHHVLRTVYREEAGVVCSRLLDAGDVALPLSQLDDEAALADLMAAEAQSPFQLSTDLSLRARLLRFTDDHHVLLLTLHHIGADGWSLGVLAAELKAGYDDVVLPPMALQYADFANWQQNFLAGTGAEVLRRYWRRRLDGAPPTHGLPLDYARGARPQMGGALWRQPVPAATGRRVRALAREAGVTDFVVLLAAYALTLSRLSGDTDIVIGVPASGRIHDETKNLIGCFVNSVPMRVDASSADSVQAFLGALQRQTSADLDHQAMPFDALCELLAAPRMAHQHPLFQLMFGLQRRADNLELEGLTVEALPSQHHGAPFDCNLTLIEDAAGDGYCAHWEYSTALFDAASIERIGRAFLQLLDGMLERPQARMAELQTLSFEERVHMLRLGYGGPLPDAVPADISTMVAQSMALQGNAIAIVDEHGTLSYQALQQRVTAWQHHLAQSGIRPGEAVGVSLAPCADWVVAMLALLAHGAVYVPIDPELPAARRVDIAVAAGIRTVLGNLGSAAAWQELPVCLIDMATVPAPASELPLPPRSAALAYMVFTSGSTGTPKGVCIGRNALADHVAGMRQHWNMGPADRLLAFLPLAIDGSIEQTLCALVAGCALHLRTRDLWTVAQCASYIADQRISVTDLPVVYLQMMLGDTDAIARLRNSQLRLLSTGGDTVPAELVRIWHDTGLSSQFDFYNAYGPSEATITATLCRVDPAGCATVVPIGRPLPGRHAYVVDHCGQLVAPGVCGELLLGGHGLARGYLQRSDLTAVKFLPDPWQDGGRIYRTGDRVRWRDDGNLEFLGRTDDQVKIRGFRIELAEVEAHLLAADGVEYALTMATGKGSQKRLLAAVAGATLQLADQARLLQHLQQRLPSYMWPQAIAVCQAFPQQSNGKADRKALLRMAEETLAPVAGSLPDGERECLLADLWAQALGLEAVAADADYFSLGGDSIVALQIVAAARAQGLAISVRHFFTHSTVRAMAVAAGLTAAAAVEDESTPAFGALPAVQEFLQQRASGTGRLHMVLPLEFDMKLAPGQWSAIVQCLLASHPALHHCYPEEGGVRETIADRLSDPAVFEKVTGAQAYRDVRRQLEETLHASIDSAVGPVCAFGYLQTGMAHDYACMVLHHVCADAVSLQVLQQDLNVLLRQLAAGRPLKLSADNGGVAAYGRALERLPATDRAYWLSLASAPLQSLAPAAAPGPARAGHFLRATLGVALAAEATAPAEASLLGALFAALAQWRGRGRWGILVERHGRDAFEALDVSRSVGWFTAVFPLVLEVAASDAVDQAARVKALLDDLPQRGAGYGHWLHGARSAVLSEWEAAHGPRLSFNYFGQLDRRTNTAGAARIDLDYAASPLGHDTLRPEWIAVSAAVQDGTLQVHIDYDSSRFEHPEIAVLKEVFAAHLQLVLQQRLIEPASDMIERMHDQSLAVTPMQEFMLHNTAFDDSQSAYLTQLHVELDGALECDLFRQAWETVAGVHQALRSGFLQDVEGRYWQRVHPYVELEWCVRADPEGFAQHIAADARQPFKPGDAVPMRFLLLTDGARRHAFLWTHHHALLDGWSVAIVLQQVLAQYQSLLRHEVLPLAASPPLQSYAHWLRQRPAEQALSYWQRQLHGRAAATRPVDWLVSPASAGHSAFAVLEQSLPEALTRDIKRQAQRWGVTVGTLLQTALVVLLHRYAPDAEISYGLTISGRPDDLAAASELVGMFINSLPIRVQLAQYGDGLQALALDVQRLASEAAAAGFLPLPAIAQVAPGTGPLFNVLFVFENYPKTAPAPEDPSAALRIGAVGGREYSEYPLSLVTGLSGDTLGVQLMYHCDRFRESYAEGLLRTYVVALGLIASVPEQAPAAGSPWTTLDLGAAFPTGTTTVLDAYGRQVPHGVAGQLAGRGPGPALRMTVDEHGGAVPLRHRLLAPDGVVIDSERVLACVAAVAPQHDAAVCATREGLALLIAGSGGELLLQRVRRCLQAELPEAWSSALRVQEVAAIQRGPDGAVEWAAQSVDQGGASPENPLEAAMQALWCEMLSLPEIDVRANYFELGGDSLRAVRLLAQVRRDWQVTVAVTDLARYASIRELSSEVARRRQDQVLYQKMSAATNAAGASGECEELEL